MVPDGGRRDPCLSPLRGVSYTRRLDPITRRKTMPQTILALLIVLASAAATALFA